MTKPSPKTKLKDQLPEVVNRKLLELELAINCLPAKTSAKEKKFFIGLIENLIKTIQVQ
jgi:hypothetical protein